MTKQYVLTLLLALVATSVGWSLDDQVNWKKVRVLVYTKNGKGYVHDNIPNAVQCIQKLGQQHGFKVDVSDQPAVFTEENLKQYTALIFPSTNNDVFDTDAQRLAFRRYIEAGGGFVGIHSVIGTERNWLWFKRMLGGTFAWHPHFQKLKLTIIDTNHPSMQGLPKVWEKGDECYFSKEMSPGPTVVMAHDLTSLTPQNQEEKDKILANRGSYTELYPAAWYYNFDGGYTWCTALGHDKKDYEDPTFTQHIFQGVRFVVGQVRKIDFSKAYADSRDTPIK
ncbi:ThuA domain-containing protein [Spirosoma aureum]|uniref:ThuA domain-containing protein n=1 Tax=Spirosoma aureum TaxID=2692134 RepID=A0A6G9AI71_9BACT|nr:ThuA domain-containing protein [Spirosoma aureum]QIP12161.1 ThuA domain-containing protein [Spirosoma aureum]